MAYLQSGLKTAHVGGAIGTGDGSVKNIHSYITNDTLAVVETASYFDSAAPYLNVGDTIIVTGDIDGTLWTQQYGVASISAATVFTREDADDCLGIISILVAQGAIT